MRGHGRIEQRTISVRSALKGYSDWPYLEQVFKLDTTVTIKKLAGFPNAAHARRVFDARPDQAFNLLVTA